MVRKLAQKVQWLKDGTYNLGLFSEFGLRRRLSAEAQELAVKTLCDSNPLYKDSKCIGTSNVLLAKKFNVVPVGTMAHEFVMCVGQGNPMYNPAYSNGHGFLDKGIWRFERNLSYRYNRRRNCSP